MASNFVDSYSEDTAILVRPRMLDRSNRVHSYWRTRKEQNLGLFTILVVSLIVRYVYYAIYGNIFYFLNEELHFDTFHAVCVSLAITGSGYVLTIFGGILGEAVMTFFKVIKYGLLFQLAGAAFYVALGFSTWLNINGRRGLFFASLATEVICLTMIQASLIVFGAEQIKHRGSPWIHRYFQLYYWFTNIGSFVAMTVTFFMFDGDQTLDKNQDGLKTLGIVDIVLTVICIPIFIAGKLLYTIPEKDDTAVMQVFLRKNIGLLRHLWHVSLILTIIMVAQILHSQIDSTYSAQAKNLNYTVVQSFGLPPDSTRLADDVTILLCLPLFWLFKAKSKTQIFRGIHVFARMAIGLSLSTLGVICAGVLEYMRYNSILNNEAAPSVLLQIPQFCLQGVAELYIFVTGYYFAFTESPKGLSGLVMGLCFGARGVGSFVSALLTWSLEATVIYPKNLKKGHFGRYMFILAGISILNLIAFVIFSRHFERSRSKNHGNLDIYYTDHWQESDENVTEEEKPACVICDEDRGSPINNISPTNYYSSLD